MEIKRLDKIVQNNVSYSTNIKPEFQMVYILQDISETLAMIYDIMSKKEDDKEWEL